MSRWGVQTIRKTAGGDGCGHCCDGCGWTLCDFYDTSEMKDKDFQGLPLDVDVNKAKCILFGGAYKHSSQALFICDKIYGSNYEGCA